MRCLLLLCAAAALTALPDMTSAQTLQQRMEHLRTRQAAAEEDAARSARALRRETAAKMNSILDRVQVDASLRDVVEWWAAASGVSLVVNWRSMENEGVYPEAPVAVDLTAVPAHQALSIVVRLAAPETEFVWDIEAGYVHLMTKAQANRMPVLAVYDVMDLLMEVPNFTDAPEFDLGDVLEGGGSGGGGSRQLFGETERERERPPTKRERGEALAQLVRDTIEPTLWDEAGGTGGHSVRYWNGRLIVRAPKYVQRQIGIPVIVRSLATGE